MQLGTILRFKQKKRVNSHLIKAGTIAMLNGIDSNKPTARKVICEDGFTYWTHEQNINVHCDIIRFK